MFTLKFCSLAINSVKSIGKPKVSYNSKAKAPSITNPERDFIFGPEYIIPTYFDPRLIYILPVAIAKAAADSGVA
jgi:malic enzyme